MSGTWYAWTGGDCRTCSGASGGESGEKGGRERIMTSFGPRGSCVSRDSVLPWWGSTHHGGQGSWMVHVSAGLKRARGAERPQRAWVTPLSGQV